MDQEGCAAIGVALEQTHAFLGRVPRFDYDVVQLVAEEVIYHGFILVIDFEKVGKHSGRS